MGGDAVMQPLATHEAGWQPSGSVLSEQRSRVGAGKRFHRVSKSYIGISNGYYPYK